MKNTSLSKQIEKKFRQRWLEGNNEYVNGAAIERWSQTIVRTNGSKYKASQVSRRLREMESGRLSNGKTCDIVLERKEEKSVFYRYKPSPAEILSQTMKNHLINIEPKLC